MAHVHQIETAVSEHDTFPLIPCRLQQRDELVSGYHLYRHGCIIPTVRVDGKRGTLLVLVTHTA